MRARPDVGDHDLLAGFVANAVISFRSAMTMMAATQTRLASMSCGATEAAARRSAVAARPTVGRQAELTAIRAALRSFGSTTSRASVSVCAPGNAGLRSCWHAATKVSPLRNCRTRAFTAGSISSTGDRGAVPAEQRPDPPGVGDGRAPCPRAPVGWRTRASSRAAQAVHGELLLRLSHRSAPRAVGLPCDSVVAGSRSRSDLVKEALWL